jgi:bacteriorhodopsin
MTEVTETGPTRESYVTRYICVAPSWHTLVVLSCLLCFSLLGVYSSRFKIPHGRLLTYVVTMVVEWSLVSFLGFGIKLRGLGLRDLIGGRWSEWPAPP